MSDHDKDIEILAPRHPLDVLQRQLADQRLQLRPEDRASLAALLTPLARATPRRPRLLISPDTVLRWHRGIREPETRPRRQAPPDSHQRVRGSALRAPLERGGAR